MNDGASLTAVTVIVNVCVADVSTPPPAVPPSSTAASVIVAEPLASAAGVKVSVPSAATAGPATNSEGVVLPVMLKEIAWPDSSAGPAETPVAQPATVCAPASSSTVWSAPFVNDGASLMPETVTVIVPASFESTVPSLAVNVNESVPTKSASGV